MKPFMKLFVKLKCSKQDRQWLGAIRRGVLDGGVNARLSRGDAMILGERRCHDPRREAMPWSSDDLRERRCTECSSDKLVQIILVLWLKSFLFCDSNHSCFVTPLDWLQWLDSCHTCAPTATLVSHHTSASTCCLLKAQDVGLKAKALLDH